MVVGVAGIGAGGGGGFDESLGSTTLLSIKVYLKERLSSFPSLRFLSLFLSLCSMYSSANVSLCCI